MASWCARSPSSRVDWSSRSSGKAEWCSRPTPLHCLYGYKVDRQKLGWMTGVFFLTNMFHLTHKSTWLAALCSRTTPGGRLHGSPHRSLVDAPSDLKNKEYWVRIEHKNVIKSCFCFDSRYLDVIFFWRTGFCSHIFDKYVVIRYLSKTNKLEPKILKTRTIVCS